MMILLRLKRKNGERKREREKEIKKLKRILAESIKKEQQLEEIRNNRRELTRYFRRNLLRSLIFNLQFRTKIYGNYFLNAFDIGIVT